MQRTLSLFLVTVLGGVGVVCGDEPLIGPASVRKVYDDGRHNAFTALVPLEGRVQVVVSQCRIACLW